MVACLFTRANPSKGYFLNSFVKLNRRKILAVSTQLKHAVAKRKSEKNFFSQLLKLRTNCEDLSSI